MAPTAHSSFETGKLAQLADGAVVARIGDTVLLATATASRSVREGADFFPLTVDIEERTYAAGKIPGSFFRREGKSSDQAILTDRLIDRPLRPSFPKGFRNEVHIVGTVFGADQVNPHDVLAINAASAALMISGIPFEGPIGAVRVAYSTDGQWIPQPTFEEGDDSTFELVVAGRALCDAADAEIAIMMVEAGGSERSFEYYDEGAPQVTEEVLADGLEAAKTWIRESIELQREMVEAYVAHAARSRSSRTRRSPTTSDDVFERVEAVGTDAIAEANKIVAKAERNAALDAATASVIEAAVRRVPRARAGAQGGGAPPDQEARPQAHRRGGPAHRRTGHRRDPAALRRGRPVPDRPRLGSVPAWRDPGAQRDHAGHAPDEPAARHDRVDDSKRYMHHYNFPPYSTGETGFMRGPKRREIGHGLLAERALLPVMPSGEEFPYTLRLVSDVLASNGSTSMASVCGSTLSLMAAGVPIKAPVAGIAMGLVSDGGTTSR